MARQSIIPHISRGERSFICAMLGTSVLGAMLACVAVLSLSNRTGGTSMAITYWTLFSGCIGGAAGLWTSYERWFGHAGVGGWLSALCGTLVATGVGSVIGGTLILPFYGTMFAPFQLVLIIVQDPILGFIWLGMLLCSHVLLKQWRIERDSIFATGSSAAY